MELAQIKQAGDELKARLADALKTVLDEHVQKHPTLLISDVRFSLNEMQEMGMPTVYTPEVDRLQFAVIVDGDQIDMEL